MVLLAWTVLQMSTHMSIGPSQRLSSHVIWVATPQVGFMRTTLLQSSELIVKALIIYDDFCEYLRIWNRVTNVKLNNHKICKDRVRDIKRRTIDKQVLDLRHAGAESIRWVGG